MEREGSLVLLFVGTYIRLLNVTIWWELIKYRDVYKTGICNPGVACLFFNNPTSSIHSHCPEISHQEISRPILCLSKLWYSISMAQSVSCSLTVDHSILFNISIQYEALLVHSTTAVFKACSPSLFTGTGLYLLSWTAQLWCHTSAVDGLRK